VERERRRRLGSAPVNPALVLGREELWIAGGGALLLLLVTLQMRRYRRRLKAKRRDGSEAEREQAGP
jgi:hypothetical protein